MSVAEVHSKFWSEVSRTPNNFDPKSSVIVSGFSIGNAHDIQTEMFSACTKANALVMEYLTKSPRLVIDLGCGGGANSLLFYQRGSSVVAIDSSLLQMIPYGIKTLPVDSRGNIKFHLDDITQMDSYGENADLVIAVNVLQYLPPESLQATMGKIHAALRDNGVLIGTLFSDSSPQMQDFMKQVGAHFYSGGKRFVSEFLSNSGFSAETIEVGDKQGVIQFQARKIII